MAESTMFADLLAAQKEMPALQKTGINPHFKNRYVPLEELIQAVLPVLNKHNFALLQCPTFVGDHPALAYRLLHVSGGELGDVMPLLCAKDDPQGQGSAITYARRYSLMSLLGLTADVDDDAETTRRSPPSAAPAARARPANPRPTLTPICPDHSGQSIKYVQAGTSKKTGKAYSAFYSCDVEGCTAGRNGRSFTLFEDEWQKQLNLARGDATPDTRTQEDMNVDDYNE